MNSRPSPLAKADRASGWVMWITRALEAVGIIVGSIALWHTLLDLWIPIDYYDEGILLTNANLILHGQVPYRDFYSNYPPGVFLLVAGLWKLTGVSVFAYRCLGLFIHLLVAGLVGRLAGRVAGRRFVWLAAGLALIWIEELKDSPSAFLSAVASALLFVELWSRAGEVVTSRTRWFLAGLALGAVSCFRHDLFVYLSLVLGALGFVAAWKKKLLLPRAAWWSACGVALPILGVWIPTIALAGVHQVAADLYFDQVNYVLPARVLPMPSLFAPTHVPGLDLFLPRFAVRQLAGGLLLSLLAPLAGAVAFFASRSRPLPIALGTALAAAVAPHMLGRTDLQHTLYTVPCSIALACGLAVGLARGLVSRSGLSTVSPRWRDVWCTAPLLLLAVWLLIPVHEVLFPLRSPVFGAPRESTLPRYYPLRAEYLEERRAALAFIDEHTRPGDPIFVGLWSHRRALGNDLDLYFLADRTGATRYMQFDPNVVTRPDVQQEMIAELERKRPTVGILTSLEIWYEPNQSNQLGASLLDEYLRSKYRVARTVGTYRLLLRK